MKIATEPNLRAAAEAHREPFLWFPSIDQVSNGSVPQLLRRLARDYKKFGKPFLLSNHGAAGVYPAEAHWLVPKGVGHDWIRKHLAPLVATTDLFPQTEQVFFHSGDLGDIIAGLPVIRQLGGGRIVIGHVPHVGNRESMAGARFEAIRPLLEAQPYITGVEYSDAPIGVTHNLALFRHEHRRGESLAHWQARHLEVENLNLEPWLTVPKFETHGKVVAARSLRYHNEFFPWEQLANKFRGEMVFVGLPEEHEIFRRMVFLPVPFWPTGDLLELAKIIAGAKLMICNQSAPFWIAAGLGAPLIQESWEPDLNSVVPRGNARYTLTGPETRTLIYYL